MSAADTGAKSTKGMLGDFGVARSTAICTSLGHLFTSYLSRRQSRRYVQSKNQATCRTFLESPFFFIRTLIIRCLLSLSTDSFRGHLDLVFFIMWFMTVSGLFSWTVVGCLFLLLDPAQSSSCSHPAIRREWRVISESERIDWISAVKCLAKLPHDGSLTPIVNRSKSLIPPVNKSSSYYDDIVYVHMDLNTLIHGTGFFFPWHRAYVQTFETVLKEKCGYKGAHPYWDWTIDAPDFFHSGIFSPDTTSGLGGWGDAANDLQITNGAFKTDFMVSYPSPHILRRSYTLQPFLGQDRIIFDDGSSITHWDPNRMANLSFTKKSQEEMINGFVGDFVGLQAFMDGVNGSHGGIHRIMGGDMSGSCPSTAPKDCVRGATWSANDPLFWLHHAMVDKLWSDWQHKKDNFWEFRGGSISSHTSAIIDQSYPNGGPPFVYLNSTMPGDGIMPNFTIHDVMNTTGGTLCYVYA